MIVAANCDCFPRRVSTSAPASLPDRDCVFPAAEKASVHSDSAACQKTQYRQNQKDEETDSRSSICHAADQSKPKQTGKQSDHKECQCKVQHISVPFEKFV